MLYQQTYDIVEEFTEGHRRSLGFSSQCEKEVYEIQLMQLQEQLESAMIEKEQLGKYRIFWTIGRSGL
jgi:hypothetical protein